MSTGTPPRWTVPGWDSFPGLVHGFFGRIGGVSRAPFDSLNYSARVGDEDAAVERNRDRIAAALGCDRIAVPVQVHGDHVVVVEAGSGLHEADALIAAAGQAAVGVLTADCVPLLLVVPEKRLVAAVHAGWKGTALGIVARAADRLVAMSGVPPSAIHAALGPSIGPCCYEVGSEVVAAINAGAGQGSAGEAGPNGKAHIDLRAINARILERTGVAPEKIAQVGPCTRCAPAELFSHRGSGGRTGRQLSVVSWI